MDDDRTLAVRAWLTEKFAADSKAGSLLVKLYSAYGQRVAAAVRDSGVLRAVFTPIFERALYKADLWLGVKSAPSMLQYA